MATKHRTFYSVSAFFCFVLPFPYQNFCFLFFYLLQNSDAEFRVRQDGQTSFVPGGVVDSYCKFDLTYFPFDVQECSIVVEAWRLYTAEQRFVLCTANYDLGGKGFDSNEQWTMLNISAIQKNGKLYFLY